MGEEIWMALVCIAVGGIFFFCMWLGSKLRG